LMGTSSIFGLETSKSFFDAALMQDERVTGRSP
jgi:hypothetical protein